MSGTLSTSPGPVLMDHSWGNYKWKKKRKTLCGYVCALDWGLVPIVQGDVVFFPMKPNDSYVPILAQFQVHMVGFFLYISAEVKENTQPQLMAILFRKKNLGIQYMLLSCIAVKAWLCKLSYHGLAGTWKAYSGKEGTEKLLTTLFWYWCSPASEFNFQGLCHENICFLKEK